MTASRTPSAAEVDGRDTGITQPGITQQDELLTSGRILRIGVAVSGAGTNLQALIDASRSGEMLAAIVLVGCNRLNAPALERAALAGLPICMLDRASYPRRADRQRAFLRALTEAQVDLVVLAGFDEILASEFVQAYEGRIINTHPSLLPAFGGTMQAVQQALEYGVKITGCTVHLVTEQPDGGPILLQCAVSVLKDDTVSTLHARILEQEHLLLPLAVRAFAEGRVRIEGRHAHVLASAHHSGRAN